MPNPPDVNVSNIPCDAVSIKKYKIKPYFANEDIFTFLKNKNTIKIATISEKIKE